MILKFGEQVEMFDKTPDDELEPVSDIPTDHEVMEKLAIAKDETRTLLNHIVAVCFMYEDNESDGTNHFLDSRLDPETAIVLRDSLNLIYRCLDVASRGLKTAV